MRLVKFWQGCCRYRPEKFPHGCKISATLLADFLIFARCSLWTSFVSVCVCTCVCFKSHLEQIADSNPDQALLQYKIGIHYL